MQPEEAALLDNPEVMNLPSDATLSAVGRLLHLNQWGSSTSNKAGAEERLGLTGGQDHGHWPALGPIKLMVAVTSSCCSAISLERRVAIRK